MNRPAPRAKPPPTPPHPFSLSNLLFLFFLLTFSICYFLPSLRRKLQKFRLKRRETRAERVRRELILSLSAPSASPSPSASHSASVSKLAKKSLVELDFKKRGRRPSPSAASSRAVSGRVSRPAVLETGLLPTSTSTAAEEERDDDGEEPPATPTDCRTAILAGRQDGTFKLASVVARKSAALMEGEEVSRRDFLLALPQAQSQALPQAQSQAQSQAQAQALPQAQVQVQVQVQVQPQAQLQPQAQSYPQALSQPQTPPQPQPQSPPQLQAKPPSLPQSQPHVPSQPVAAEKTQDHEKIQEPEPEPELDPKKRAFAEAMRIGGRKTSVCSVQNVELSGSCNAQPQKTAEDAVRKAPIGFLDSRQPSCTPAPLQFGHEPSKASSSSTLAVPMNRRGSTSSNGSSNSVSVDGSTSGRLANRRESTSSQSSRKTSSSRQDAPPRYDSLANTGGRPADACRSPSDGGPRSSTHPRARRSSNYRANQTFMSPTYVQHAQSPMLAQHQSTAMAQQHAVYAMALQQQYSKAVQQLQQHQMLQNGINQMSAGGIGQPQVLLDQLASQLTQAEDYVRSLSSQLMQAQQQLQMHQDQVRQQQAYAQFMSPTTPQFYGVQTTPYHTPLQTPFTSSHTIPQTPQSSQGFRNHPQNETVLDEKQVADMVAHAIMRPKGEPPKDLELVKDNYNEEPIRYTSNGWNTSPLSSSQVLSSASSSPSKGGSQTTSDMPDSTGSDGLPQYDSGPGSLYAGSSNSSLDQKAVASKLPSVPTGSILGEHNSEGIVLNSPPALQTFPSNKSLTADVSSLAQHQALS